MNQKNKVYQAVTEKQNMQKIHNEIWLKSETDNQNLTIVQIINNNCLVVFCYICTSVTSSYLLLTSC